MSGGHVQRMHEFTAWVIKAMDGWPGDKAHKRKVIELMYDAYRQGRIHGMDAPVNAMRQCVEQFDAMVKTQGRFSAKLIATIDNVMSGKENPDA